MDHRPAPRPHMWRMYVQTLLPDATQEPAPLAAPHRERRCARDRRQRRDRARRAVRRAAP